MASFSAYNARYFQKWYRDPKHQVNSAAEEVRKVALAIAVAEYYLDRPVRTVLDVGCGEGQWRALLRKFRPRLHYTGVDPSPYVIRTFGRARNLLRGALSDLDTIGLAPAYDLIVCSHVLYYATNAELEKGLASIGERLGGVAFLEAYPGTVQLVGDTRLAHRRPAAYYRRLLTRHGFISCGSHCYVGSALAERVTPLERGWN